MWSRTLFLATDKRLFASVGVAVLVIALIGSIMVSPALVGGGTGGPLRSFSVTFEVLGNESEVGAGSLPYDSYAIIMFNVTDPNLTLVECRLEWEDQGRAPLQDPYVNLAINFRTDSNLSNIDEIDAPGGVLTVEVPNPIPANVTVTATSEDEAISRAAAKVNNTTAGVGEWWIRITTQAPSDVRPFVGGEIDYRIWLTLRFYEGVAFPTTGR